MCIRDRYYKWTQWIFLQLWKHGLAYKATMPVNWCTSCKCVLANEEVVEGVCERCGAPVIRKEKSQWMLKITEYAQRLIDDLDDLDFIERVKIQQKNWIGRSTGAEVTFKATAGDDIVVFTTRPDTLFGATYMVQMCIRDRVTGQVHAAEQGRLLVEGGNDLPGAVFGAVVDKEHPALFADFPCGDKLFQLGLQALGGLGQDLLVIVTGYDEDVYKRQLFEKCGG